MRASLRPGRPDEGERTSSLPAEKSLNALDEAIALLSKLETGNKPRTRRGRIDLAALLYEVAPECRIEIAPGAGTEVVGDEQELRRMLHLLLSTQNSGMGDAQGARSLKIRREGAWINISVDLGPDAGASSELERRWLSRMAVRHGGKLELRGRQQTILLPAETSNQEELEGLRRELFEAQQLGETYARELASVLGGAGVASPSAAAVATPLDVVRAVANALLPTLQQVSAKLTPASSGAPSVQGAPSIEEGLRDWVSELSSIAKLRTADSRRVDLRNSVHAALARSGRRAQQRRVEVVVERLDPCPVDGNAELLDALVRAALEHAISASPPGWKVRIELHNDGTSACLRTHDGGPPIPEHLAADLLDHRVDPGSLGRPSGLALLLCRAITLPLEGNIAFRSEGNGNVTEFHLPVAG
jgi:two-component system, OmpR family, sensor kinase